MRVFGSLAFSLIPQHKRNKFDADPKRDKLLMVDYSTNSYTLGNPATNEIIVLRNVSFNENYKPIKITQFKSQEYLDENFEDKFDEENNIKENNPELKVHNIERNVQQDESSRRL